MQNLTAYKKRFEESEGSPFKGLILIPNVTLNFINNIRKSYARRVVSVFSARSVHCVVSYIYLNRTTRAVS